MPLPGSCPALWLAYSRELGQYTYPTATFCRCAEVVSATISSTNILEDQLTWPPLVRSARLRSDD